MRCSVDFHLFTLVVSRDDSRLATSVSTGFTNSSYNCWHSSVQSGMYSFGKPRGTCFFAMVSSIPTKLWCVLVSVFSWKPFNFFKFAGIVLYRFITVEFETVIGNQNFCCNKLLEFLLGYVWISLSFLYWFKILWISKTQLRIYSEHVKIERNSIKTW